ncbi:MAG: molybdate ABC transporter substrate-binding protein, partial [Eubacteriales bacterium]|nr:molybdate ABC transporter substrate-binding protein [Eubacteriales bacterium]
NTDGSDKLYHQMKEGAPADLFISASQKWMKKSVEDGIVDEADQRPFLNNEVVMIRNIKAADMKLADIKDGKDLSLGAESVPVGGYTKKYFEQTKQWDAIAKDASFEPKVTDVVQKVAEGARNYGLVYQTDANSEIKKGTIAVCDKIPEDSGIQVIYPIGITKKAENRKAAEAFEAFLSEGTARDVLEDVGFVYVK